MNKTILPVHHKGPHNSSQQDFVFSEGEGASMKKKWKMGPDHDGEPLSEVPVPGMGAVEICHPVDDVELQKVVLNQRPLEQRDPSLNLI